jgi:hypothetical protein
MIVPLDYCQFDQRSKTLQLPSCALYDESPEYFYIHSPFTDKTIKFVRDTLCKSKKRVRYLPETKIRNVILLNLIFKDEN